MTPLGVTIAERRSHLAHALQMEQRGLSSSNAGMFVFVDRHCPRRGRPFPQTPLHWGCNPCIRPMRATVPHCQSFHRGGSLMKEMRRNANWARIVVAIFTMAVFYGSVCSTTCAIGFCPNQAQQMPAHDCESTSSHHSHHSSHPAPAKPDCSEHRHPGLFLAKSGNLSPFALSTYNLNAVTAVESGLDLIPSTYSAEGSDLAPPLRSIRPLYQKISVLRI